MNKLRPVLLLRQSIVYTFSSSYLWLLMASVFLVQILFDLGYRLMTERYPGAEYLYVFFTHIFFIWWYLVVAVFVLHKMRLEPRGLAASMRAALTQTWGAWWLVAWMTLLSWARISLVCEPYYITEGVDLILLLLVSTIGVFQLALNFFMIPEMADKNYAILHLYVAAFDGLKRQFFRMVQFFLLLFALFCTIAICMLVLVMLTRALTECVVLCPWMPRIAETIIESGATTITLTILIVAQTLFYLRGARQKRSDL